MELIDVEKNIGKQIKMLRMAEKISQKEMASRMGVTYQQVQKYENGLNRISVSRLWQVCKMFNISPDFFFQSILDEDNFSSKNQTLIPNTLASSQDVKMMLAFKAIEDTPKKALMIKVCQAMAD